jgi:hypothetical protein
MTDSFRHMEFIAILDICGVMAEVYDILSCFLQIQKVTLVCYYKITHNNICQYP